MEALIAITTIIVSILSSGGIFLNNSLTNLIKNQSFDTEKLEIRVNSVPSYQLLTGSAQQIQVAARGWELNENIRLELFELETDKIQVNLAELDNINRENWRQVLLAPLNMGFHVILTEEDLNNLFKSALVKSIIADFSNNSRQMKPEIIKLNFDLLPNNQIAITAEVKLGEDRDEMINIDLQLGLELIKGHQLKIINPQGTLNQRRLSSKILQGFADNINMQLDLRILESSGINVRFLQFDITENNLDIIGLAHISNQ